MFPTDRPTGCPWRPWQCYVSTAQLADHYRHLMVDRNHNHISAYCAVARKLVNRAWAVIETGHPYEIRDPDGTPLTQPAATRRAAELADPDDIRRRRRAHQRHSRLDTD